MIKARNERMVMIKKIIAIIMCVLSEFAIGYQLRHPRICMGTFNVWKAVHKISENPLFSWITVLVFMLLAIALLIFAAVLIAFIQREKNGEVISYSIYSALLIVILGMFVSSGMFGYSGLTKIQGAIRGLIVMVPYLTVFIIENFTLTPFSIED